MALTTKIERIRTYCSEAEHRIKEIKKELDDFDGYNSLEVMEVKINRAVENLDNARDNIIKAYDDIEEE